MCNFTIKFFSPIGNGLIGTKLGAYGEAADLLCIPGGGLGSAARLRAMIQHEANVLCCTPTYAMHMAEVAEAEGFDAHSAAARLRGE